MSFKQYQIVIVDDFPESINKNSYPWKCGEALLYLGEVVQMPGHCIIVNRAGKVFWGWHEDNFRHPLEDEI